MRFYFTIAFPTYDSSSHQKHTHTHFIMVYARLFYAIRNIIEFQQPDVCKNMDIFYRYGACIGMTLHRRIHIRTRIDAAIQLKSNLFTIILVVK